MVATPIGNLADITLRALHVLQLADVIACEDTRHTQNLLRAYGLQRPGAGVLALHQHNEADAASRVIALLQQGLRVACVSDAGTPAISDPGARLVHAVHAAGLRVMPLPGASSITTALCAAGLVPASHSNGIAGLAEGWVFAGFLPSRVAERRAAMTALQAEPRSVVLLEAPHRIQSLAQDLIPLGGRPVTLARELTKQHETIVRLPACDAAAWLGADPDRCRGEFVVVIHAQDTPTTGTETLPAESARILQLLLAELPTKTAVKLAAAITASPRNLLYAAAIADKT